MNCGATWLGTARLFDFLRMARLAYFIVFYAFLLTFIPTGLEAELSDQVKQLIQRARSQV